MSRYRRAVAHLARGPPPSAGRWLGGHTVRAGLIANPRRQRGLVGSPRGRMLVTNRLIAGGPGGSQGPQASKSLGGVLGARVPHA